MLLKIEDPKVSTELKLIPKNHWSLIDYISVGVKGFPPGGLVGIDITSRCNLNCRHCYFRRGHNVSELSFEEWVAKLKELKRDGAALYICGWLGGEPLLRVDVLEMAKRFFKSNVIFTNGTQELPSWEDCTFVVSVPGTRKTYSYITGTDDKVYDMVKEHADRPELDIVVSFCITRQNRDCIEPFLEEWSKDVGIKGVFFEFYTPAKGEGTEMWLDWDERDRVMDRLFELKRVYGDFIHNSFQILNLMRSKRVRQILLDCPFGRVGLSLDSMGRQKFPCTLGPSADCSRCGCILPVFSVLLHKRSLLLAAFFAFLFRMMRDYRRFRVKDKPPH